MSESPATEVAPLPKRKQWTALFLHGIAWGATIRRVDIADGIVFCVPRDSAAWKAYETYCESTGAHDADPYWYGAAFSLSPVYQEYVGELGDPYAPTSVLSSLVVAAVGAPIGMVTALTSFDAFTSIAWHADLHNYGGHNESLITATHAIDNEVLAFVTTAWGNLMHSRRLAGRSHRVWNAVTYLFYAWTARYSDQKILNLAILLEVLFAPHSQAETTHQIAFNIARYLEQYPDGRQALYRSVKRLYGVRSTIVHGGSVDEDGQLEAAADLMSISARLMRRILSDREQLESFEVEAKRKALLDRLLFT